MRKLSSFLFVSLDGYYKDADGGIGWHTHGEEEAAFSRQNLEGDKDILLFGRTTYEMMAGFWPTSIGKQTDAVVAAGMTRAEKIVFSNALKTADWENTKVMSGDIISQMRLLKETPGKDMTLLGSGSIVKQFIEAGLIDELQLMIDPVAIGAGTSPFQGLNEAVNFELMSSRPFSSGTVLLTYQID